MLSLIRIRSTILYFQHIRTFCANLNKNLKNPGLLETINDSGTRIVWSLNRPTVRNAINRDTLQQLLLAMDKARHNDKVTVAILSSLSPNMFCSGADLKERLTQSDHEHIIWSRLIRQTTSELARLPFPVIAAIDGPALGGGFELALACDIRVAVKTAKLAFPETSLGIIPGAGGTQRVSRLAGQSVALDLILTGKEITGSEAHGLNLVNYTVEQIEDGNAAYSKALNLSDDILKKAPIAIRAAKKAIIDGYQVDLHSGLSFEQLYREQVIFTKDNKTALNAFARKEQPVFEGK